jgi:xanthine dehydrogenase accessory factor
MRTHQELGRQVGDRARAARGVGGRRADPALQAAVADVVSGSAVLIMSFSHAEDLEVLASCLKRQRDLNDLTYIGLIGSASKWARFKHRLEERGFGPADFERVTTPIGLSGIHSKLPEVSAVSVAAQLLQLL